jgi:hypothetical protein
VSSNAAAHAALGEHIARVEALGELASVAAPDVAEAVEAELLRQISAGTDAEGRAWRRREDGGRPLESAGKALTVVAAGKRVLALLRGHIARHHRGIARGGIVRAIFPAKGLPPRLAAAVKGAVTKAFDRTMGDR